MSTATTTLADVLYPGATAPGGAEPQSPPSDLTPNSPSASSPGSDDDGTSRKRSASGSIKEGKERTANKICRVCGDKAYSYNFNVITCESCKAFFRRNANKEKEIRCPFNESCEINVVSRRFCQRCRLFKCFQVGMKKEWIMTDEARLEKKARVEENRERRKEEAKKKDDGSGYHHYRTASVSSGGSGGGGSCKTSQAAATAAAAAAAVAETANMMQQQHIQQHHQQQHHHHQQAMYQPDLPTLPSTATTHDLLDALAQQAAAAAVVQQHQQFPTAAMVAAVVAAPPSQPTSSELVAHAIALEQQMQQQHQQVPTTAATAAAVYQAAAAHHHHQQQQHMAAAAAVAQQIVSMTTPATQLVDVTMAAALSLPPAPPTTATAAAIINAAVAANNASPLGQFTQAALMMDATAAAATQQLQQQLAAVPPPPSALAAVASTMLLPPAQQHSLLQPAAPSLPDRCCCTCQCGKYHSARTIVDQAQEEWEAERRERRSSSSEGSNDMGLSDLLPSASTVSWLNPATNQNPLTEGSLSNQSLPIAMSVDDAYPTLGELKETFLRNPLFPPSQQALGLKTIIDHEFGPMQADDEARLKFLNDANDAAWKQPLGDEENRLHQQQLPSKETMLQMMVGGIKRMINMTKRFPALRALHPTDQMKLIQGGHLDLMIIRGAMSYDPVANAWKGPTASHDYNIKMDAMNDPKTDNMMNQSIRLYTMFKEEYRSDENVMLLLNMIVLFDPNVKGLSDVVAVRNEHNAYKRCLKRLMFTKQNKNLTAVQFEYKSLLERLATVRSMNTGARGIMVEHLDNIDPLLKELMGKADDGKKASPKAKASPSTSSPSTDQPSTSSRT